MGTGRLLLAVEAGEQPWVPRRPPGLRIVVWPAPDLARAAKLLKRPWHRLDRATPATAAVTRSPYQIIELWVATPSDSLTY